MIPRLLGNTRANAEIQPLDIDPREGRAHPFLGEIV